MNEEFRVIPGYENYTVTKNGVIKSIEKDLILSPFLLNGYKVVSVFRGSLTRTLPVHRAVALAWIKNNSPDNFTVVNHKDGNTLNNYHTNLEWTDYSGNNYHAVNTGLRRDPIACYIRCFYTKQVMAFNSIAQACAYMGLSKDTPYAMLKPKMFGKLIAGKFEFKYANETTPWFYEHRTELVKPSRYMVIVIDQNNTAKELYSTVVFLKTYQLYDSPYGRSIPGLAKYAAEKYPAYKFIVRDSYIEEQYRVHRATAGSKRQFIQAIKNNKCIGFMSLTSCAKHFNVDRSVIKHRIKNGGKLDGWIFSNCLLDFERVK
uniref:HNH homing endonuclease n=1 Tax=Pseudomonas phage vB_PaeM_FBPa36 TaxID=3231237 RepID=A0AAU8KU55_9VIRU